VRGTCRRRKRRISEVVFSYGSLVVEEAVVRSWRRSRRRRRRRAASLLGCSLLFVWGVSSGLRDRLSEQKRRRRQRRRRRRISGFNNCMAIFSAPLAVETVEVVRYDACK